MSSSLCPETARISWMSQFNLSSFIRLNLLALCKFGKVNQWKPRGFSLDLLSLVRNLESWSALLDKSKLNWRVLIHRYALFLTSLQPLQSNFAADITRRATINKVETLKRPNQVGRGVIARRCDPSCQLSRKEKEREGAETETFPRHLMCESSDAAIDSLNQKRNEERNHNSNLHFKHGL